MLKRDTLRTLDNMQLKEVRGGDNTAPVADTGAGDTCPGRRTLVKP